VAELVNDLEDTKEDLEESKKFHADLNVNCEREQKERVGSVSENAG